MKNCPDCNTHYEDVKKFCGKCGIPLETVTEVPVTPDISPEQHLDVPPDAVSEPSENLELLSPEPVVQVTQAAGKHLDADVVESEKSRSFRAGRFKFLFWLAPFVVLIFVVAYLQQRKPAQKEKIKAPPVANADSAVAKKQSVSVPAFNEKLTVLPDFIPRKGIERAYSAANPGWERYKGATAEFRVLREDQYIKAIQMIDRGNGISESVITEALRQVAGNPLVIIDTSGKKDGFEIQRGRISNNINIVYYREESNKKLRAFVLTWN